MSKYETSKVESCKFTPSPLKIIALSLVLFLSFFFLPLAVFGGDASLTPTPAATLPAQPERAANTPTSQVTVLLSDGTVLPLDLEEYVWRVLAAEMPAAFQPAALEAQSVAIRTYALRKAAATVATHPQSNLCTQITCCQAYRTPEEAAQGWGDGATTYAQKLTSAVTATRGLVLRYDGKLIDAVFHSSSAGQTEDAAAVWGNAVPYLVAVASPEGDGTVPNYQSTVTLTNQEFAQRMASHYPEMTLPDDPAAWFGTPTLTAGGMVSTLPVGDVEIAGTTLRTLLGLRSARFTITQGEGTLSFSVTAYGHGVGLSQYGANVMAAEGATCQEILSHYYTGVSLENYQHS